MTLQIDGSAAGKLGGPVTVMTPMSPPSSCLILAATQHDGLLHLIDCRVGQVIRAEIHQTSSIHVTALSILLPKP